MPFEFPRYLTGAFHQWLGENELHDGLSLYSLGWLQGGHKRGDGLTFSDGATWFISAPDTAEGDDLLSRILKGAQQKPQVCCGMEVTKIWAQRTPVFGFKHRFRADSPVFIRGERTAEGLDPHLIFSDEKADEVLTHVLRRKLVAAGLEEFAQTAKMGFDHSFKTPKTRLIHIQESRKRASVCPILVEGSPEAVAFAFNVGAGHLTGCTFGSLT